MNPYDWLDQAPHVTLVVHRLPDGEKGRWYPDQETIVLDDRLNQVERRCTLMHELVHRARRDEPCHSHRAQEKQEQECEEETARLLISLTRLADALMWSSNAREVAEELWVEEETVRIRKDTLDDHEAAYLARRLAMRETAA